MDDATVGAAILEMEKPVLARGRVDPRALVGAVDGRRALGEDDARFVGAADVLGAVDGLRTGGDAVDGGEDPVGVAAFVEFRTFEGVEAARGAVFVDDHDTVAIEDARAVGGEFVELEQVFFAGAAHGPGVHEVGATVGVPERARVDETAAAFDEHGPAPFGARIGGGDDVEAEIGIGIKNPEFAGVVADRGRPDAGAVAGDIEVAGGNALRRGRAWAARG
jgi:hypothetical protein